MAGVDGSTRLSAQLGLSLSPPPLSSPPAVAADVLAQSWPPTHLDSASLASVSPRSALARRDLLCDATPRLVFPRGAAPTWRDSPTLSARSASSTGDRRVSSPLERHGSAVGVPSPATPPIELSCGVAPTWLDSAASSPRSRSLPRVSGAASERELVGDEAGFGRDMSGQSLQPLVMSSLPAGDVSFRPAFSVVETSAGVSEGGDFLVPVVSVDSDPEIFVSSDASGTLLVSSPACSPTSPPAFLDGSSESRVPHQPLGFDGVCEMEAGQAGGLPGDGVCGVASQAWRPLVVRAVPGGRGRAFRWPAGAETEGNPGLGALHAAEFGVAGPLLHGAPSRPPLAASPVEMEPTAGAERAGAEQPVGLACQAPRFDPFSVLW